MPPKPPKPKTRKRSHSASSGDDVVFSKDPLSEIGDSEVSNKDLLVAISTLTNRVTAFESSILKIVDEKVAGVEKIVMDQVNEYKQGTNDRVRRTEKQLEDFEHRITVELNTAREEHSRMISEEINSKFATNLANSDSGIMESRVDQLERQLRMNELVISGVHCLDNEKVIDIVSSIFGAVKFNGSSDAIESCFRLPSRNNHRRSSPSIIMKFWSLEAKTDFFKCYFNSKKLCTTMIGYTAPSRIYVNENLTKRNFTIFCLARDLKKDGKIVRYSTQRGRVVVKLQGSDRSYTIDTLAQLSSLVNGPATASNMEN